MNFELHPNLAAKTFVLDLPLSRVLLEDNSHYPWIFLVPRITNISRMMDLEMKDQIQLLKEMDIAQKILWELFSPQQINVAAIGNKTPQLHIHVIARNLNDPAWPGTVWDHPVKTKYSPEHKQKLVEELCSCFKKYEKDL